MIKIQYDKNYIQCLAPLGVYEHMAGISTSGTGLSEVNHGH
jgi:hypothetical protein